MCVFVHISASRKQGAVTSVCYGALLSPHKLTDYLCGGGAVGECEGTERSAMLDLMNIILASFHVQGEGHMSLVLAFILMQST